MAEIKFVGHNLSDIPSLKPVMDYMGVKDVYGVDFENRLKITKQSSEDAVRGFKLVGKSLAEVDKDDLVVSAWSPLIREMSRRGCKNIVFMVHGVCNYCGCLADSSVDRWELVSGNHQRNQRVNCGKDPGKIFAIGYPKADEFGRQPEVDHRLREEILGNDKPTILWAPPGHEKYVEGIMPVMKELKEEVDVNVILKLHAGGRHYTLYRNELESSLVRVVWDSEYTTTPLMRIADVLLSGHSSVPFEFTLCDRPIITCALESYDRVDDLSEAVQLEKGELVENLIDAVMEPERFVDKKSRLAFRNEAFANIGCATEAVAEKLQEIAKEVR